MTARKRRSNPVPRQRGFTLMLALLLAVVGGGALLFSFYTPSTVTLEGDRKTTDALALVKTALISWTAKRGNVTVYSTEGTTVLTSEAAAVIITPGSALGTQNRHPTATASCPTTGEGAARVAVSAPQESTPKPESSAERSNTPAKRHGIPGAAEARPVK